MFENFKTNFVNFSVIVDSQPGRSFTCTPEKEPLFVSHTTVIFCLSFHVISTVFNCLVTYNYLKKKKKKPEDQLLKENL